MATPKRLVLTFDAFGTLFKPKESVFKQYADLARRHGLSGFSDEQVGQNFQKAFKRATIRWPNLGRTSGMRASTWWSRVIEDTFEPLRGSSSLPPQLVPDLINRFSSSDGYDVHLDVLDFFKWLRSFKMGDYSTCWTNLSVGVITNSDDRVPLILTSLGFRVGSLRYSGDSIVQRPLIDKDLDIDFVTLSYDVGYEKPDPRIFNAAKELAGITPAYDGEESTLIHVGDDWTKDVVAAQNAGWESIYLDRNNKIVESSRKGESQSIRDLEELKKRISYKGNHD